MRIIILLFYIIISIHLHSQSGVSLDESMIRNNASKFLKSPEVSSLERYGNYPVSEATGIPDITIPLYTIKAGELEIPLSLSYHLGGVRVDDIPSCVGLGWTLNAGGYISRTIKGIADEDPANGFLKSATRSFRDINNQQFQTTVPTNSSEFLRIKESEDTSLYLESLILGYYDTQSDVYNYNIHPVNGSFVYNTNRKLIHRPYSDNKITRNGNDFVIYSNMGIQYYFNSEDVEYTYSNSSPYKTDINGFRHDIMNSGISSWRLSKIFSTKSDIISFEYRDGGTYDEMNYGWTAYYGSHPNRLNHPPTTGKEIVDRTVTQKEKLISKISFEGGTIEFAYANSRLDKRIYNLSSITVKDRANKRVKRISFSYSHFTCSNVPLPYKKEDYRLKLNSVILYGSDDYNPQIYNFQYNETIKLPPYYVNPSDKTRAKYNNGQDHWGFFNGNTTNETKVGMVPPTVKTLFLGNEIANREPSETHMKAYVLTKIIYPTGGYTIFETEANRVFRDNSVKLTGGLRVKSIQSFLRNKNIPETIIEYNYEDGKDILWPDYENYTYKMINSVTHPYNTQGQATGEFNYYTEDPISPIGLYSGSPVLYKKVTKLESGKNPNNPSEMIYNGKTVYWFESPHTYIGASTSGNFTTPIKYTKEVVPWATGNIIKQQVFKRKENGSFEKIEETKYEYEYQSQNVEVGMYVAKRYNFFNLVNLPVDLNRNKYFYYYWFNTATGFKKLVETNKISYTSLQDSLVLKKQYIYANIHSTSNNKNALLTEEREFINNDIYKTKYYYPQDYSSSESVYNTMVNSNILAPIIEQASYFNNTRTSKTRNNYSIMNGKPLLEYIQIFDNDNIPRTEIKIDKYDSRDNVLQYTTIGGLTTVYLWGYNQQYPIVVIQGATYEHIRNLIDESSLNNIAAKYEPTASDWSNLYNRLTFNLSDTYVTVRQYKPLIGLYSAKGPDGVTTYYNYDSHGRLIKIYNDKGYLKSYEYHLFNGM